MSRHLNYLEGTIDELIPKYAEDKAKLDELKATVDAENSLLKQKMLQQDVTEWSVAGYKVKKYIQRREKIDEDKLVEVVKKHNIPGVIKTREYVDMDCLEAYLYDNINPGFAEDFASCRETQEVVQLRVSKAREEDDE